MRKLLAILFLLAIGYQYMLKLGIVAWYECNKSYIASHLCENRDKPQLKCCGKCYLKKQLARADKGDDPARPAPTKNSKTEISPFILPEGIAIASYPAMYLRSAGYYINPAVDEVAIPVLHPPG